MPSEHPVVEKLQRSILPYMVSAPLLRRLWWYRLHVFYAYGHEVLVGIVGLGVAPPFFALLASASAQAQDKGAAPALPGGPPWLTAMATLALVGWVLLKYVVQREDLEKRAALVRSGCRGMRQFWTRVRTELAKPDPMPGLDRIQTDIQDLVDRMIAEDAWIWDGPKPDMERVVSQRLTTLRREFEQHWQASPGARTGTQSNRRERRHGE